MSRKVLAICLVSCSSLVFCTDADPISISGQDIQITFIHTTDIHSRLIPYSLEVGEVDIRLGLAQELEPFGGAARVAHVVERERGQSGRVLVLDTGDSFQGAPIFNFFRGEAEIRFLDLMGVDSVVIGNHEFDMGGVNLYNQLSSWAHYPALAANYRWEDPELPYNSHLGEVSTPYVIYNVGGLRVAVIGLANMSSLNSIYDTGNRLGITPLDTWTTCQYYVDFLKPQVDMIVVSSHMGLTSDSELLENVSDIDVMLGGHHHVVLNPPRLIEDPLGRMVANPHSGAFSKYVGRFDVVVRQCYRIPECVERYASMDQEPPDNDWEVVSTRYEVFPIDSTVPEDPRVVDLLEDYTQQIDRQINLNELVGYAPNRVRRYGSTGGDSPLGNLVASAMRARRGVQTDFALTNTLGIRADFNPGPISIEEMFNVFPFENTIATLNLSGSEVQELFDFVVERSAGRGCNTQAQVAGAAVLLDCGDVCPQVRLQADGSCGPCPSEYLRDNGQCYVEPQPRARRILIDDASPPPSDDCVALQETYNDCCEVVARCGCQNDDCTESICEDRARGEHSGCNANYEPSYSTDPCPDDAECVSRGANQRCFVQAGREQGRCMYTVVDNYELLDPYGAYQLAANDYIARGGSGFRVLGRNTSQNDLEIPLRDVLVDHIRQGQPCTDNTACTTDDDCLQGETCACNARSRWDGESCSSEHDQPVECPLDNNEAPTGRCILASCVDDVAAFRAARVTTCHAADSDRHRDECLCDARRWAAHECEVLPCIDENLGAVTDGRQTMVQP